MDFGRVRVDMPLDFGRKGRAAVIQVRLSISSKKKVRLSILKIDQNKSQGPVALI